MNQDIRTKYELLIDILRSFDSVGVACSGGVDSTFLAYCCSHALGPENIVILFGDSSLLSSELRRSIEQRLKKELGQNIRFKKIEIDSLAHAEFVKNTSDRCYICKKNIYLQFLDYLDTIGVPVLFDGTNCDDLNDDRPGHKALKELKIKTPLVEAGFTKSDIRTAASEFGLGNASLPSNSCLATRIETNTTIIDTRLREIEVLESFLINRGYQGCRVRPRSNKVIIKIQQSDFPKIAQTGEREAITSYFQNNGYPRVLLELGGRPL